MTKVKVCDAICGKGKTQGCIEMMNSRTDLRFIFVTQYLTEVERIKRDCKSRNFVSPESDLSTGKTKLSDIHTLMADGRNIATTHSLFVNYTDETKDLIKQHKYVLVLDEVVDVIHEAEICKYDIGILKRSNAVIEENGIVKWLDDSYEQDGREKGRFREEMLQAKSQNFLVFDDDYFFWAIPPGLFTCFEDVYVLTYLFRAQTLRCFFELYGIDYEVIGVNKVGDKYLFCSIEEMDRSLELRDKIHILDNERINLIGNKRTALSLSWYRTARAEDNAPLLRQTKNNITNVFKNVFAAPSKDVMWTTFKDFQTTLSNKGYMNSFVPYNKRASNEYRDRHYLAYCVNNFPRPWETKFFREHGIEVDGDLYALSILIQWIFRSAIRCGEEIWVYIPSARMRTLLEIWLDKLAEGKDYESISYKTPRKSRAKSGAKRGRPAGTPNKRKGE